MKKNILKYINKKHYLLVRLKSGKDWKKHEFLTMILVLIIMPFYDFEKVSNDCLRIHMITDCVECTVLNFPEKQTKIT